MGWVDVQAQKEKDKAAAPLAGDDLVGSWYSNPGGAGAGPARPQTDMAGPDAPIQHSKLMGVGKYLRIPAAVSKASVATSVTSEGEAAGEATAAEVLNAANGPGPPPSKKPKKQGYGNFDAW